MRTTYETKPNAVKDRLQLAAPMGATVLYTQVGNSNGNYAVTLFCLLPTGKLVNITVSAATLLDGRRLTKAGTFTSGYSGAQVVAFLATRLYDDSTALIAEVIQQEIGVPILSELESNFLNLIVEHRRDWVLGYFIEFAQGAIRHLEALGYIEIVQPNEWLVPTPAGQALYNILTSK